MYRDGPSWVPAFRPGQCVNCIVMACEDHGEAEAIDREMLQVNTRRLRAYESLWQFRENPPREHVAAVILATSDDPETVRQALQWTRQRWPHCSVTVVGDVGGEAHEIAARENGANFLTRPVTSAQWRAVVGHAAGREQYLEGGSSPERAGPLTRGLLSGRPEVSAEPAAVRSRLEPPANVRIV
jgi:DNA-binding NtrC family response regulator